MSDAPAERLATAVIEALDTTAFLFAAPADVVPDEAVAAASRPLVTADVDFTGAWHGRLRLACPPELLPLLAGNMLGADDAPEALQLDAFGELANIVCGNVLPREPEAGPCRLAPPCTTRGARDASTATDAPAPDGRALLDVEGHPLVATLWLRAHPAEAA